MKWDASRSLPRYALSTYSGALVNHLIVPPRLHITRAILSDAIALARGDRFFNQDLMLYNLIPWGFVDCQRDLNGWGSLGRLFLRTLPSQYDGGVCVHMFPLVHPSAMETNPTKLGKLSDYSLDRPKAAGGEATVANYVEAREILQDIASNYAQRPVIKSKGYAILMSVSCTSTTDLAM